MPWLGLPSSSLFHLNVQVRTGPRMGRTPKLSQSLLVQIPKMLYLNSAVHCAFCFGRFLFSDYIDRNTLLLCDSWTKSQTHLHPEEWHRHWRQQHLLGPADAGEPSQGLPVLLQKPQKIFHFVCLWTIDGEYSSVLLCYLGKKCFSQWYRKMGK